MYFLIQNDTLSYIRDKLLCDEILIKLQHLNDSYCFVFAASSSR